MELTISKNIMATEDHKPVWEKNVPKLLAAQWSQDDKYVICSAQNQVVVLRSSDGELVWSRGASGRTRLGANPKELLVRSPDQRTVEVLSLDTGDPIREFNFPSDLRIYDQRTDGSIFSTDMSRKKIIQITESGEAKTLFDVNQTNEVFGALGRGPHAKIIFIDDTSVFFTVKGYLGLINRKSGRIIVPDHRAQLFPHRMLQRDSKEFRFLTATSSSGIVGIDASGNLTEVASIKVYEPTFLKRDQRLLVYGESTGEHQPAFVNLKWLDTNRLIRIPWLSEEIGGVIPDSNLSKWYRRWRGARFGRFGDAR